MEAKIEVLRAEKAIRGEEFGPGLGGRLGLTLPVIYFFPISAHM
jgi:hypothetical protein